MNHITCVHFKDLTLTELYDIMNLRQEVFVLEQNCVFIDADYNDQDSWHLSIRNDEGKLLAYARLLPEGLSFEGYTSIGRVVNSSSARGTGIGKVLMQASIAKVHEIFGQQYPIKIGAQSYLLGFYASFGFVSLDDEYMEDGIPHTHMVL